MKTLIYVSPKKIGGIITAIKWTIHKLQHQENTTQTILRTKYAEYQSQIITYVEE
jgi:hypothetical protein